MILKCEKDYKILVECPACHGKSGCSTCNYTGLVCPVHGGFWKR